MKITALQLKEYGEVTEIKEDIVRVKGLANCMNGQLINFGYTTEGIIVGFDEESVLVLILKRGEKIKPGDKVFSQLKTFELPVGEQFLGRVVNALGKPVDGNGVIKADNYYPIFREAASVLERVPVREPLETGIKIIDMMIPLGRGQRELIIGDRMTGKTTIVTDTILQQKGRDVICIYCFIGKADSSLQRVLELFKEKGAFEYTIVLTATASAPLGQQYLAPYTSCSLGEYFMYEKGKDVLICFDDLTKHAWVYRELSLLLERSPGRDAYPGDIFYLHSQMVERACKLGKEKGNGSMTFLPIAETLQGDVTGYIPTNLISMTDGQLYLSSSLFGEGFKPAIDLGLSVTRIGNKVQWPAIRELCKMLRLEYLQYRELLQLTRIKAGVSEEVEARLKKGGIITEILRQNRSSPIPFAEQVILLYALRNDFLNDFSVKEVANFKESILTFIRENKPELIKKIADKKELTEEIKQELNEQLTAFNASVEK